MPLSGMYRSGFVHVLAANVISQGLGLVTILAIARLLTPVELGEVRILQSYMAVFAILAGFGINTAVLKLCSEKRSFDDRRLLLGFGLKAAAVTSGAVTLCVVLLSLGGLVTPFGEQARWLAIYALTLPLIVASDIIAVFLQALKRMRSLASVQTIVRSEVFLVVLVATWLWGVAGFVFGNVVAQVAGLAITARVVGVTFPRFRRTPIPSLFSRIAIFSVLGNGVEMLGQYSDIFVLDHFSGNRAEIGYYSLAALMVTAAIQLTATAQVVATPYFSERAHEVQWLRRTLIRTQLQLSLVSILVSALIYGGAVVFINTFYGPDYQRTLVYLPVLLLRYAIWSAAAMMGVALLGLGHVKYNFIVAAISTAIGFAASYVLLDYLGPVGVAWGQVFRVTVMLAFSIWALRLAMRASVTPAVGRLLPAAVYADDKITPDPHVVSKNVT